MVCALDSHPLRVEGLTFCLIFCLFSILLPAVLPFKLYMVVITTNTGRLALGYAG
jgi:hypothetical protein